MTDFFFSAREAEHFSVPEQQAFEFADIPSSPPGLWTALPMRCPGREDPLLWQSELQVPGHDHHRVCLQVSQDRFTLQILSYRLTPVRVH